MYPSFERTPIRKCLGASNPSRASRAIRRLSCFLTRITIQAAAVSSCIVRINAALAPTGLSYSRFIFAMKKANITLDRKILADLAMHDAAAFAAVVEKARASA